MSNPNTLKIIEKRRSALARISLISPHCAPVLVSDPKTDLPRFGGGTVREYMNTAYIWNRPFPGIDPKEAQSLWVHVSDTTGYAAKFKAFLTELYGVTDFSCLEKTAPPTIRHQIDHVSASVEQTQNYADKKDSTAISPDAVRYHLLEAVPQRANSSGGGLERKMAKSSITSSYQRNTRLLRMTHLLKLYGLMTPLNRSDEPRYSEACRVMGKDGWDPAEIRQGLDTLFDVAAMRKRD